MMHDQVTLPNAVAADLFFGHYYPGGAFDYIQAVRSQSLFKKPEAYHHVEEAYWSKLEANRTAFADQIPADFDLIIDAPSNSGWHRPYVSAVRRKFPKIQCVSFIKEEDNSGVKVSEDKVPELSGFERVLIVDDVFSTGKVAGRVIDKLRHYGLNNKAAFVIACPLRMVADISFDEIAAAVAAMSQG